MIVTLKKVDGYGNVYESEYETTQEDEINFIAKEYFEINKGITEEQFKIALKMLDCDDSITSMVEDMEKEFIEFIENTHEDDDIDDDDELVEKGDGIDD